MGAEGPPPANTVTRWDALAWNKAVKDSQEDKKKNDKKIETLSMSTEFQFMAHK